MADMDQIFTLTDEEGNESQFELIGNLDINGNTYVALVPVDSNSEEEEYVILTVEEDENGEEFLEPIEDDDEYESIAEIFMERLEDLYDFES